MICVKCTYCKAVIGYTLIEPETTFYCPSCKDRYKRLFAMFEESESPESMVLTSPLLPSSQDYNQETGSERLFVTKNSKELRPDVLDEVKE